MGDFPTLCREPATTRDRLEDGFTQLHIILDVCITCHKALDVQNAQQDESVANIPQRCGSDSCTRSWRN
jgi:hypothetical protein